MAFHIWRYKYAELRPQPGRGIEWSLRAREHCVSFFLRATAVIKFVLRVASTLENTTGEQRTLHKFSANFARRFIRVRLVP